MNTTHQKVAARLNSGERLSSEECNELRADLQAAIAEIEPRIAQIRPGGGLQARGEVLTAALLSGTPEEVKELREEFERLTVLKEQLRVQETAVNKRRQQAFVYEAAEGLPGLYQVLEQKIAEAEAAQRALEAKFDELDAAYTAVVNARGQCSYGGLSSPIDASPETIDRLMRLSPFAARQRPCTGLQVMRHVENIGRDFRAGQERAA